MLLTLTEAIKSRAHCNLRRIDQLLYTTDASLLGELEEQLLRDGEELLGIYENVPGQIQENVIFTTFGIHVFLGKWEFIDYGQIENVNIKMIDRDKTSADGLLLRLSTGRQLEIPIIGGSTSRTRWAWSVLSYVGQAARATKRRSGNTD